MQRLSHRTLSFDGFTLDLTRGCLLRGTQEVKLRPKPFDALKYLVENPCRLISKAELIKALWPDTSVTDDSLVQCLMEVRRALGDEAPQIIKTVHGRGYIFDREVRDNGSAQVTTYTEETAGVQVIIEEEETNGHVIEAQHSPAPRSVGLTAANRTTGLARLTTGLKQHRWTAVLGVLTLAVAAAGIVYFTRPGEAIDSVAVMPFVNESGDPNTEYLSDGISESIINSLSQLPSLKKVIARNSVLRYKGKQTDPQAVGRELNVRAVLMGRLTQRGDDLVINVELVDVRDNRHLWGQQYNRKLADITTVPTEIAQEISEKLRLRLSGEEKKQLAKHYTENSDAYRAYLQGSYYWEMRTVAAMKKSIEYFEQAIKMDPGYAPAYVGLATVYLDSSLLPPNEARQKVESLLLKALELDNDSARAHALLGSLRQSQDDWPAAERELKRAIELNPRERDVHWFYGQFLSATGRNDEAVAEAKRMLEIDPLSPVAVAAVGFESLRARHYDQAIEFFREALEMDPSYAPAHTNLARAYVQKGLYEAAIAEFQKAMAIDNAATGRIAALAYTYAISGKKTEAQKMLKELEDRAKQGYVPPVNFAIIYTGLGEKDQAFDWLEKAYKDRSGPPYLTTDLMLDGLRSDPRFVDLARRKGLA